MSGQRVGGPVATGAHPAAQPSPVPGTIARVLRDAAVRLQGVADNPRLEARLLLSHALGLSQGDVVRQPERAIETDGFESLLIRRVAHEPLAFIVGHREFWSLDFLVSNATLIPRPDSETVIEAALGAFANRPLPRRILDLGTGTGCLLLALLAEFPTAYGVGLDLAEDAAALARANAARLGLANRAGFCVADWARSISGHFDLIVSNPPYIPRPDIDSLMPEVARHEPRRALDGGVDGFDAYRSIMPELGSILDPNGAAVLELGVGQANYVEQLARSAGFEVSLRLDLAQIARAIVLTLPSR